MVALAVWLCLSDSPMVEMKETFLPRLSNTGWASDASLCNFTSDPAQPLAPVHSSFCAVLLVLGLNLVSHTNSLKQTKALMYCCQILSQDN